MIENVASKYSFNQETKLLFLTAASLLARLTNQLTGDLRDRLFDRALTGVKNDRTLWIDVCEMAFQFDHLEGSEAK